MDLHKNPGLRAAVADIIDCRRVLRELDEPHSWIDAFQLHRLRRFTHNWLHWQGYRSDG